MHLLVLFGYSARLTAMSMRTRRLEIEHSTRRPGRLLNLRRDLIDEAPHRGSSLRIAEPAQREIAGQIREI